MDTVRSPRDAYLLSWESTNHPQPAVGIGGARNEGASMPSIVLYKDTKFGGETHAFGYPVDSLESIANFNDQTSSCEVKSGTWILYEDTSFQGKSSVLTLGKYSSSSGMGIGNDTLSSLRPFPEVDTALPLIMLFKGPQFHGPMIYAVGPIADLGSYDFNDVVSSIIVVRGNWTVYRDARFGGTAYSVSASGGLNGNGRYPDSAPFPNDVLSSLQPTP
jgi:hypothetical protein